jgi:hypothetical protein
MKVKPPSSIQFAATSIRKAEPHLAEKPAEAVPSGHPHEHRHILRNFLFETFTLPLILFGLPSAAENPAPMPVASMVQLLPSGARKAADTQRLNELVQQHQSSDPDPGNVERRERLLHAIEKVAEIHEKLIDQNEAIEAVLDSYARLESERGTQEEEIGESLKKIREWWPFRRVGFEWISAPAGRR